MSKHSKHSEFVSKAECLDHVTEMENTLQMILNALRGPDLRGGLVRDVNKIFTEMAILKSEVTGLSKCFNNGKAEHKENRKLILGFIGSLATAIVSVLIAIFK